ncbi:RDD family protein [Actinoplanes sp. NPDC051859]|uniref:RDD family protein n=1 Tax=Actinoplanes sp. NPDC051859 TaxID=3363909 RepID=UPI0037A8F601
MPLPATSLNVRVTGRRVVATLIDGFVLSLLGSLIAWLSDAERPTGDVDLTALSTGGKMWLLGVVLLYYVLLEGLAGRTVGKLVTGIRVIDAETGGRPGVLSAFVRTLLRLIDSIFGYLVALIIVVNSDRRRRLGDMAAKTLVVRV